MYHRYQRYRRYHTSYEPPTPLYGKPHAANPTKDYNSAEYNPGADLAKHKKRRHYTPPADAPPADPTPEDAPPPDIPPAEIPPMPEPGEADRMAQKLDRLYWGRIVLATMAGISAVFLFESLEGEARRWASILYMMILFAVTIFVARIMGVRPTDRKKIVTQALPSYIFLYLFVWVLTHTIIHVTNPQTVSSPLS